MSALAELSRLEAAVTAQRLHVDELDVAKRLGPRKYEREHSSAIEEARESERSGVAAELELAIASPQSVGLTPTIVERMNPHGGVFSTIELVDELAEARYEVALERLRECEAELRVWARANADAVAVERAPRAQEIAECAQHVLGLVAEVQGELQGESAFWARLLRLGVGEGEEDSVVVDLPHNPFEGVNTGVKIELPLPKRYLPAQP